MDEQHQQPEQQVETPEVVDETRGAKGVEPDQALSEDNQAWLNAYVTPPGEQQFCPDCGKDLAQIDTSAQLKKSALLKHRGSKTCLEFQERVNRVISRRSVEHGTDKLTEPVVFEAMMTELKVILKPTISRPNPVSGMREVIQEGFTARFKSGRYQSDDPEIVALMRNSPSNIRVIERSGGYPREHKDRFYEVAKGAVAA